MANITITFETPSVEGADALSPIKILMYGSPNSGITAGAKRSLLALLEKVAYIDENGQTYLDALEAELFPPASLSSISAVYSGGSVMAGTDVDELRDDLTVTANYDDGSSEEVTTYTLSGTISANPSSVTVSYSGKAVLVSIPVVTLSSITAVYTQSGAVYDTDALDVLRADLVVTAHYSDSSTAVVTDYTLTGTLTQGTSSISVSYGGKTTSFSVTVTHSTMTRVTSSMSMGTVIAAETGVESANSRWFSSDYIPIDSSWVVFSAYNNGSSSTYLSCAFYDSSKVYVSGVSKNLTNPINIPSGVAYVRIALESSAQSETETFEFYSNLSEELNWSSSPNGAVNNNTGAISTSGKDAYIAYDIPVASDDRLLAYGRLNGSTFRYNQGAFYTSDGTYISGFKSDAGADMYASVPSNASKFAIQVYPNNSASNNDPAHQMFVVLVK